MLHAVNISVVKEVVNVAQMLNVSNGFIKHFQGTRYWQQSLKRTKALLTAAAEFESCHAKISETATEFKGFCEFVQQAEQHWGDGKALPDHHKVMSARTQLVKRYGANMLIMDKIAHFTGLVTSAYGDPWMHGEHREQVQSVQVALGLGNFIISQRPSMS